MYVAANWEKWDHTLSGKVMCNNMLIDKVHFELNGIELSINITCFDNQSQN